MPKYLVHIEVTSTKNVALVVEAADAQAAYDEGHRIYGEEDEINWDRDSEDWVSIFPELIKENE